MHTHPCPIANRPSGPHAAPASPPPVSSPKKALNVDIMEARQLQSHDWGGKSDPYVVLELRRGLGA